MKGLLQRVTSASVAVEGEVIGEIGSGLLLLLGVERDDNEESLGKLLHKVMKYRIFADDQGRMNRSVSDIEGGILVVSQFTLAADTRKGLRPGFSQAADPQLALSLYEGFVRRLREAHPGAVACGKFGADMQVSLTNDGPVTFLLEV